MLRHNLFPAMAPRAQRPGRQGVLVLYVGLALSAASGQSTSSQGVSDATAVREIAAALQARQFTDALRISKTAAASTPGDPRLWTLQAIAYSGLNDASRASESYHHALELAPDYLPALQGAAQLAYAAHGADAEGLLERVLKLRPDDLTAHGMLGALAFQKGKCATAAEHFAQAKQAIEIQPEALREYSTCLVQLSKFSQAVPVFARLLQLQPESRANRYNLALAQWSAGQTAEAQSVLEPALAADSPSEDELTLAAELAESKGDTQRALELLRRAILLEPRTQTAYLDFANLAYNHASAQVGVDMVSVGVKQIPGAAELYAARGVLLCQLGKIDEAMIDFDRANQLNPKLSFVGVAQGIAASQSHDAAGALNRFRRQVKQHPDDALAHYLLAEALSELGKPEGSPEFKEEVAAAQQATRLDPNKVEAHDLLASAYLQSGNVERSIAESRAALSVNPKDQQALYHLVLALKRTDDRREIPALLGRLMQARDEEQTKTQQTKRYMLVELKPGEQAPH